MKTLVKKLPILAFVLAIASAFAFNLPQKESELLWFALDEFGNVGPEMDPTGICQSGNTYCAVGIDINDLNSNGEPQFVNVEHIGASAYYDEIVKRD